MHGGPTGEGVCLPLPLPLRLLELDVLLGEEDNELGNGVGGVKGGTTIGPTPPRLPASRNGLAINSIGFIPCARPCSLAKFNNDAGCRPVLGVGEGVGGMEGEN